MSNVRVRFSQGVPDVAFVTPSHASESSTVIPINLLLAELLKKPMSPFIPEREYQKIDVFTAASIGVEQTLKDLAQFNPSVVSQKNLSGWTPLLYAANLGHQNVCTCLLNSGAPVDDCNFKGQTALMMASACGNINVVRLLLERNASTDRCDKDERQALHYAANCRQRLVVDALLDAGADPNAVDVNGLTPVHEAANNSHELMFQALLEKGGDPYLKTKHGEDALYFAGENARILQIIADRRSSEAKIAHDGYNLEPSGGAPRTPRTLDELLEEMNFERLAEKFSRENIDLDLFFELNEKDFEDMGIAYGPKKRMLTVIERYRATGIISTDTFEGTSALIPAPAMRTQALLTKSKQDTSASEEALRSLRFVRDVNERIKMLAIEAMQFLQSGSAEKLRPYLTGIIDGIDDIAARVARHDL